MAGRIYRTLKTITTSGKLKWISRLKAMLRKEFIHIRRDPKLARIVFIAPIVQVLIFGYAVSTDVTNVATAVLDLDNTPESRSVVGRFVDSGYFTVTERAGNVRDIDGILDNSSASLVIRMDNGFAADIRAGRPARLQLILDGTDSNTAGIVMGYSATIINDLARSIMIERIDRTGLRSSVREGVDLRIRPWFNETLSSRNFYVPGVMAVLIMLITLLLTSLAIVREKEMGTIEQIMVTPISKLEFILGKSLPFAIIGMIDVAVIALVGTLWFEVPMRGSLLLLFACAVLYLTTGISAGLLISTICQTQQQALMSVFLVFFPCILLSGFMFPIANMPQVIQWITYLDPIRYFLVIVRGIFLKGVGFEGLWPQMLALTIMGGVLMVFATMRFKKTMS